MTYKKLSEANLSSYVIVSDASSYTPIEVTDRATSGTKIADIKIDGQSNELYVTKGTLSAEIGLSDYYTKTEADRKFLSAHQSLVDYMRKDELSNYLSVVDEAPSEEVQAANPQVIWFVKKQ